MSNAQNHQLAKAVNRILRMKGIIRVDQMLKSYQRLMLIAEAYHPQTVEDLWIYVQRCIAIKAQGAKVAGVDDQPEGPAVPAPAPAKPKRKRAPRKAKTAA